MKDFVSPLLQVQNLADLRALVAANTAPLSLPNIKKLKEHAQGLSSENLQIRLGVVHTYTSDLLDPWLELAAALQGAEINTYHAPYGLSVQEAQQGSELVKHEPDVSLFMLTREDLHPALADPLVAMDTGQQETLRGEVVERVIRILQQFRAQPLGQMVVTLMPALSGPALGQYDAQSERSEAAWWSELKSSLAARIRESLASTLLLDLDQIMMDLGREQFFDQRLWYSARYPFAPKAAQAFSQRLVNIGISLKRPKVKVIVLDADNTLWGGVIGEDGITGIALGPEYPGNLYVAFQRRLLDLQQRGFILAICSKNNPEDLQQVFDEHPHQLIKANHLAARRVNWTDKPENLRSLAKELNLGLDSFIFIDDSDYECAAVRQLCPEVEVIQTPAKPMLVPGCLEHVARLEILSLTDEDRGKTQLYSQERNRKVLQEQVNQQGGDLTAYLQSLQMEMKVSINDANHLKRLAQLTQKTNQFNLTTRRYDEQQMQAFLDSQEWLVGHFSLADTFGDSGVVGLALWHRDKPGHAVLDTFLMSCRVIGRRAETAFLDTLLGVLLAQGVTEVTADYLPTPKNVLVKNFLSEHGFTASEGRYHRDLAANPPESTDAVPIRVELA
jgi:FkbH-like protein